MALPDPDEDHLLPTTAYPTNGYPPSSPRTKRHHGWIFASPPCVVLCLISLVLIGLLSYQAFAGQWGLTTLSWGVPSPILDGIDEDLAPPPMKVVEPWTLDRLEGLVNQTRGYFARDYSLWLGWNNMRYIIEASVLQASLLNRTLIIPSFVYARHCEYPLGVCAAFAEMVNRGDAMGSDQWRLLSWEEQMGWKVPMEKMIDMQGLRDAHAVVTMSEYLSLRSLPPNLEQGNGQWSDDIYQVQSRSIPNSEWDPPEVIRVDQERPPFVLDETEPRTVRAFQAREAVKTMVEDLMENKSENRLHQKLLDWDEVLETMQNMQVDMNDDDDIELFLRAADFEVLHTYRGVRDHEFVKSVATPIKQVARMSEVHGCVDDYGSWDDEVVLLQGEVHDNRKPGFMRFTSTDNMQSFTRSVLYDLRSLHSLAALATRIDERMRERTGGRMWRAAHLRRGDCGLSVSAFCAVPEASVSHADGLGRVDSGKGSGIGQK